MLAGLRTWLGKTPVKILLGLLAAYYLFAWFAFEPLLKWAAPKYIGDKSGHHLSLASAKFDPFHLSLDIKGLKLSEPDGSPLLAFDELFVDFDAASLFRWAYSFDDIRLSGLHVNLALLKNGKLNWTPLIDSLAGKDEEPVRTGQRLPRLLVHRFELEESRLDLADRRVGFESTLNPLDLTLDDLSTLPDDKGSYAVAATTRFGARIRWHGELSLTPTIATGRLAIDQVSLLRLWPYLKGRLNMAPPQGQADLSLTYRFSWIDRKLSLLVDKLDVDLSQLVLGGVSDPEPAIRLDKLALSGGRFDLSKHSLDIGAVELHGGKVNLNRDASGRLGLQAWFAPRAQAGGGSSPAPVSAPARAAAPPAAPATAQKQDQAGEGWKIRLARFNLDGVDVRYRDAGFLKPLDLAADNLCLGFNASADVGGSSPQAKVEALGLEVADIRLRSGDDGNAVQKLGDLHVADGVVDLTERSIHVGSILLQDGILDVVRDEHGRLPLLQALQPRTGSAQSKDGAASPGGPAAPWHYRVEEVGLAGWRVNVRDEGVRPAARLTLQRIAATVKGVSDNLRAALPVKLSLRVKQGGSFRATGKVVPAKAAADLRLKLSNLSLGPAQPYLSQAANLTLASGRASASGRMRFDGKLRFDGGFRVTDLLLNETDGGARFLAWKRMDSDSVRYRPEALNIREIRLDGLGAKLVIDKDKTVNLKKILKRQTAAEDMPTGGTQVRAGKGEKPAAHAAQGAASKKVQGDAPARASAATPATRMDIDSIRVENGELDFADLSLALPFATRIHDLKGALNGVSTLPGSPAQLELDGRVDQYGLARAAGQFDPFDPTAFMDVKVVFRNVEMTRLTPYTATFVGRKIDSGKLSLNLEYKIKDRQLTGENQIIMDKLTLGERVQSPTAKDLPLDLAIAILQDDAGRIDLGLPVSGSLDDPQFSYGRIIWKAIGNVIAKIVTAPFRALASLFGGNAEKLEQIVFEPGRDSLTPPEKEKFVQIAKILNKRPKLALSVHPTWSATLDRPALKEARLRRAVMAATGVKLKPGEEAGPVSTANPKVQTALEDLYAARFGEDAWKTLQGKWFQANPEKKRASGVGKLMFRLQGLFTKEEPLTEAEMNLLKGSDLHVLLYQRLLAAEGVSDADLRDLARRRGAALVAGLVAAGAPSARVSAAQSEAFTKQAREVPARMELEVAK